MKRILIIIFVAALSLGLVAIPASAAFNDVPDGAWYASDVEDVQRYGIIKGTGNGRFEPHGTLTLAQAITMASRTYAKTHHSLILPEAGPWYECYVRFADQNGLCLTGEFGTNYDAPCSRWIMAQLFARVVPEDTNQAGILRVDIPDLSRTQENVPIYHLYELGILVGNDNMGTFTPSRTISRAEVAAILNRLLDPSMRKHTLITDPVPSVQTTDVPSIFTPSVQTETPVTSIPYDRTAREVEDEVIAAMQSYMQAEKYEEALDRDSRMDQAARLLAGGTETDMGEALSTAGFDQPLGKQFINAYTYREHRDSIETFMIRADQSGESFVESLEQSKAEVLSSFPVGHSSGEIRSLSCWDRYGLGVAKVSDGYKCVILTYKADRIDKSIYSEQWSANKEENLKKLQETHNGSVTIRFDGISDPDQQQELRAWAEALIGTLPQNVIDRFNQKGWVYIIAEPSVYSAKYHPKYSHLNDSAGVASECDKHIAVKSTALINNRTTTYHEFGHFIDYEYLGGFQSEVYFERYKDTVMDATGGSYAGTNSAECFAEAYRMMWERPEVLKEKAPEYYELVQKVNDAIETGSTVPTFSTDDYLVNEAKGNALTQEIIRDCGGTGVMTSPEINRVVELIANGNASTVGEAFQLANTSIPYAEKMREQQHIDVTHYVYVDIIDFYGDVGSISDLGHRISRMGILSTQFERTRRIFPENEQTFGAVVLENNGVTRIALIHMTDMIGMNASSNTNGNPQYNIQFI